jgi:hypothetical protein
MYLSPAEYFYNFAWFNLASSTRSILSPLEAYAKDLPVAVSTHLSLRTKDHNYDALLCFYCQQNLDTMITYQLIFSGIFCSSRQKVALLSLYAHNTQALKELISCNLKYQ